MSTVQHMRELEADLLSAAATLERERYYDFTWSIQEFIRSAKHYQQIAESLLAHTTSTTYEQNTENLEKARANNDWYSYLNYEE